MDSVSDQEARSTPSGCSSSRCDDEAGDDQESVVASAGPEGREDGPKGEIGDYPGKCAQEISDVVRSCQESWYNRWRHTY